jgi:hypothetical protein
LSIPPKGLIERGELYALRKMIEIADVGHVSPVLSQVEKALDPGQAAVACRWREQGSTRRQI